jgi:hypothetical protein
MNIDAEILNKILANQFNSISKRSYTMIKSVSSQGCRDGSTYTTYNIYKHNIYRSLNVIQHINTSKDTNT